LHIRLAVFVFPSGSKLLRLAHLPSAAFGRNRASKHVEEVAVTTSHRLVQRKRARAVILAVWVLTTGLLPGSRSLAAELIDRPSPLPISTKLSIATVNQGHIAVMQCVPALLQGLKVDLEVGSFVRFADARTALTTGSVDVATIGPGDIAIALSQGVDNVSILAGIGSSSRYVIERNGVDLQKWSDLSGKKIGIPNGSATWMQFAAKLEDVGQPYTSFEAANIQGGGPNFVQALKSGEVDAIIIWEPFESQPGAEGFGRFATSLDYSDSKEIGSELGVLAATRAAMAEKREATRRFMWAYMTCEQELRQNPEKFADAIAAYTGVDEPAAGRMSKRIKLGGVLTVDQLKTQAAWMYHAGIIQRDVADRIAAHFDTSIVASVKK
jgi:sulfonate transport system substrate-binding protein